MSQSSVPQSSVSQSSVSQSSVSQPLDSDVPAASGAIVRRPWVAPVLTAETVERTQGKRHTFVTEFASFGPIS